MENLTTPTIYDAVTSAVSAPVMPSLCSGIVTQSSSTPTEHRFDPFLSLIPEKREALLASLLPRCEAARPRERKWKQKDYANYCDVLVLVVANALSAAQNPLNKGVHYSRTNTRYSGASVNYPNFLRTPTLKAVVDTLGFLGMFNLGGCTNGYGNLPDREGPFWQQSTFEATDLLSRLLGDLGMTAAHVIRLPEAPVIHLHKVIPKKKKPFRKGQKKKSVVRKKTVLMEFDPTEPLIVSLSEEIRSYNNFLASFDVSLDLSSDELLAMHSKPRKDLTKRPPINISHKALFRSFNDDFEHGGRFFGGWWISIPSEYRDHLLIDGAATVELDYSGCFLRMLYHLEGRELEQDPYDIPAIRDAAEKQNLDWGDVRKGVKELTNIYLNALDTSSIGKFPDAASHMPKGFKRPNAVYKLIHEHHQSISHNFRTGCALRLMKIEADICQGILLDGVRDGVPVLPVHDSFVVPAEAEGWLYLAMTENYRKSLGFDPKIKKKDNGGKVETVKAGTAASRAGAEGEGVEAGTTGCPIPVSSTTSTLGENVREPSSGSEGMATNPPSHHGHILAGILAAHRQLER